MTNALKNLPDADCVIQRDCDGVVTDISADVFGDEVRCPRCGEMRGPEGSDGCRDLDCPRDLEPSP